METQESQQATINQFYNYAADLIVNQNKNSFEVTAALVEKGLDNQTAITIVDGIEEEIRTARKKAAQKDILYGALWCGGGTIATLANVGFIFWGAILFGGIQLVKGIINYNKA